MVRLFLIRNDAERIYWDKLFKKVVEQINGFVGIDFIDYLCVKWGRSRPWKEYRTALITAAVTGKIDVRNQVKKKEAA